MLHRSLKGGWIGIPKLRIAQAGFERLVRGQWTTADGLKTEVVTVTIVAGDDIADYDPDDVADLYEYWKAEARYWDAG